MRGQTEGHAARSLILHPKKGQQTRAKNRADHPGNQHEHRRQWCDATNLFGHQHGNRRRH